ncbi:MAG: response regulator transcription factor [Dehalococcoidales bacterium]|nr:response regulator transcription factor [Dehalococcoidales bacterium]
MAQGKILVVDDEKKIVDLVRTYLERDGYQVFEAHDGSSALDAFRRQSPDLVILDVMLPGMDGLDVCREIRRSSSVPVIMLTARSEDVDKLVGLELGADDYITKPFSPRELVARVRAVLRRTRGSPASVPSKTRLTLGDLMLDEERFEAVCHEMPLALTPAEFRILAAMAKSPGRVFSRAQLLDNALGESYEGYERTIDVHIKNLRHKLKAAGGEGKCSIVTVHGVGYKIQESSHFKDAAPDE